MPVVVSYHLLAGTDELRRLARREPSRNEPGRCGVAQRVGRDWVDASEPAGRVERRLDAENLVTLIFDNEGLRPDVVRVEPFPSA